MPRRLREQGKYRRFNGKLYGYAGSYNRADDAKKKADSLRDRDFNVRVVRSSKTGIAKGRRWTVYQGGKDRRRR